ncbi:Peroxidase [Paracoccus nototheniae]|uniref:peroxidase family protein n=1 Tax=Paracoccus nototheniae TaxID=2489002 RepID=UPI00103AB20B|nr:heme peroxidase family protein [Paracoccus nototheniae]
MIYSKGHGRMPLTTNVEARINCSARTFRYLDAAAPQITPGADRMAALTALGQAMSDPANFPGTADSDVAPIFTYFGQFIDHDISAGTDGNPPGAVPGTPLPRDVLERDVVNLNTGMLDLDSLYGDVIVCCESDAMLATAMRHPTLPGKMLVAKPTPVGDPVQFVPLPTDGAGDLVRLDRHIDGILSEDKLRQLTDPALLDMFFFLKPDGTPDRPNLHRALIGDARNDENLFVAQFHLAMLRLHNRVVDACDDQAVIAAGDQALFEWAKTRVRWIYQWLIVNTFLPAVCEADTLARVMADGGAFYAQFLARTGGAPSDRLPLPMEFSAAAFRFGHSMVRQIYDWNDFFRDAGFNLLFAFTGGVANPMLGVTDKRLPSNWVADWTRTAIDPGAAPNRAAQAIDTNLSAILAALPLKANDDPARPPRNLAVLNLIKGDTLNLPCAQAVAATISAMTRRAIPMMDADQIAAGPVGHAIAGTPLAHETPLWFYVLREAEAAGGLRLGPLGTTIVAGTLLGLVTHDASSYWHQPGSDGGRWRPADMPKVSGVAIASLPDMLRAAKVL